MKLNASITGVGTSKVGQVPDRSALQLQADAAQAALADAGLRMPTSMAAYDPGARRALEHALRGRRQSPRHQRKLPVDGRRAGLRAAR